MYSEDKTHLTILSSTWSACGLPTKKRPPMVMSGIRKDRDALVAVMEETPADVNIPHHSKYAVVTVIRLLKSESRCCQSKIGYVSTKAELT